MMRGDVQRQLSRLMQVYSVPKHMPSDLAELARVYGTVLESLDGGAVAEAVTKYLGSAARFFPTPGALAELAGNRREARSSGSIGAYLDWEADWGRKEISTGNGYTTTGFTACPVCGVAPTSAPRLQVRHLAQRHRNAGIPAIGYSDEVEEFYAKVPMYADSPSGPKSRGKIGMDIAAWKSGLKSPPTSVKALLPSPSVAAD